MIYSWEQHQNLSRLVSDAADTDKGVALALMGIGLLMLANDLLSKESVNNSFLKHCEL